MALETTASAMVRQCAVNDSQRRDGAEVARAGRRRVSDYLGLTRPRDRAPYTWPFAFGSGLGFGIASGVALGFTTSGRAFSWEAFFAAVAVGVALYAPLIHWASHRNSKL